MGGRLLPLLQVASLAAWRLGFIQPKLRFAIQLHDEEPREPCLRYDAWIHDPRPLLPDPYALGSHGYRLIRNTLIERPLPPWHQRRNLAFWRGASTGSKALTVPRLKYNMRYQLCRFSGRHPDAIDAKLTSIVQCRDPQAQQAVEQHLRDLNLLAPHRCTPREFGMHRFLIEIDGNVNSWGLLWKLLSGSCILRVGSTRRQWYHDQLVPYRHVVPIAPDLSDLANQLAWCQANPHTCASIAAAGETLARKEIKRLGWRVLQAIDSLVA